MNLIDMILRRVMGRLINRGITHVAGGGKDRAEMTPEERRQARSARQTARRARQAARLARRMMR